MDGDIDGTPTASISGMSGVFRSKIDKGLADEENGAQVMKPNPGLDALLEKAVPKGIFGTKMRSNINAADVGIAAVVEQQFEVTKQIAHGLVPIIEPEVNIKISDKAQAKHSARRIREKPGNDPS